MKIGWSIPDLLPEPEWKPWHEQDEGLHFRLRNPYRCSNYARDADYPGQSSETWFSSLLAVRSLIYRGFQTT
jgi:hypothetical protein